ncbi:hypothetical protein JYU34_000732, partial [Plutella xylostella]
MPTMPATALVKTRPHSMILPAWLFPLAGQFFKIYSGGGICLKLCLRARAPRNLYLYTRHVYRVLAIYFPVYLINEVEKCEMYCGLNKCKCARS